MVVNMIMDVMVIVITDVALPSNSSFKGCNGGNVKICYPGVVLSWAASILL